MYSRFATGSRGLVSSRHLFSGNEFCQEKNKLDSKTIYQEDLPPGAFSHCFAHTDPSEVKIASLSEGGFVFSPSVPRMPRGREGWRPN